VQGLAVLAVATALLGCWASGRWGSWSLLWSGICICYLAALLVANTAVEARRGHGAEARCHTRAHGLRVRGGGDRHGRAVADDRARVERVAGGRRCSARRFPTLLAGGAGGDRRGGSGGAAARGGVSRALADGPGHIVGFASFRAAALREAGAARGNGRPRVSFTAGGHRSRRHGRCHEAGVALRPPLTPTPSIQAAISAAAAAGATTGWGYCTFVLT
jgi:hypothetical protein